MYGNIKCTGIRLSTLCWAGGSAPGAMRFPGIAQLPLMLDLWHFAAAQHGKVEEVERQEEADQSKVFYC